MSSVKYPHLPKPPIEEAIIRLTLANEGGHSAESLEKTGSALEAVYPQRKNWTLKEVAFQMNDTSFNTSHSERAKGFLLSSDDQKKMVHITPNIVALHCLKPYKSWDAFSKDYETAWGIYTHPLNIQGIKDIAIRYINQFQMPMLNWGDYLLLRPNMESANRFDESTIAMGEVFSRYVLVSEAYQAESVVLLTIRPTNTEHLTVIMDIEVKSRTSIRDYPDYYVITESLNRLRNFKNQIFFSNLPKAEEMFS